MSWAPADAGLAVQKSVELLLLPPGAFVVAGVVALVLLARPRPRARRLGMILLGALLACLYLLSLPRVSLALSLAVARAEPVAALSLDVLPAGPQAIVVLGGGRRSDAAEYGGADTLRWTTLERVRYAAQLQRASGLDVLVTGGSPRAEGRTSEAEMMAAALRDEFGVPVRWQEPRSRTTAENAEFSVPMLLLDGVDHVFLVTHGLHMPRAVRSFSNVGLKVTPAPLALPVPEPEAPTVFDLLPRMGALGQSYFAIHEAVGMLWYRLRG